LKGDLVPHKDGFLHLNVERVNITLYIRLSRSQLATYCSALMSAFWLL